MTSANCRKIFIPSEQTIDIKGSPNELLLSFESMLNDIKNHYTVHLSTKNYTQISNDINEYVYLLNAIKTMNANGPKNKIYHLLLTIGTEGLIGSLNLLSVYQNHIHNEFTFNNLEKELSDIMSEKNNIVGMDNVSGKFCAIKEFQLAPIYNDYINIFGFPIEGYGFDSLKLAFLAKFKNYFNDPLFKLYSPNGCPNEPTKIIDEFYNNVNKK